VFAASVLAPVPVAADLVFLVVIFGAVYIRKFGQRWFAIGMIAFMAYFMGDYLRPLPADIGWIALAIVLSFAVTHLVTNVILRDAPEQDFRRAMVTIDRRINLILGDILDAVRHAAAPGSDRRLLQKQLGQLRYIVLMAEGFIPQGEAGSLAATGPASDLAVGLFELQLAVERMVRASYLARPPAQLLTAVLYRDAAAVQRHRAALLEASGEEVASRLLLRVHLARQQLDLLLQDRPSPAFAPVPGDAKITPPPTPAMVQGQSFIPTSLQRPIQITMACAIAMGVGLMLSPNRWYWAVITAFILFNNTKSRADTAFRAMQRSGGTFAGFIVGTVIATLLHDQMIVSAIAVPVLFFCAFYVLQRSYSLMIFFITIALALLYGVMGMFTPDLLLMRLEETLVGALAGVGVAFFVFPARASTGVAEALDTYLAALGALVVAARDGAHAPGNAGNLLPLSRTLDRAYTDLANMVRPLGGPWNAVTQFGQVREKLLLLSGAAHWGRTLARSLQSSRPLDTAILDRIDVLASEIAQRIERASAVRTSFFDRPHPGDQVIDPARRPLPISEHEDPAFSLEVISALLHRATPDPAQTAA
ncbi:MAG TPA: FUSC family protein, partial [Devosia sp.]|nr:FUSC family protein [Devosia sp.]